MEGPAVDLQSFELQKPMSYAVWPMVVLGVIVFCIILYFLLPRIIRSLRNKPKKAPTPHIRTYQDVLAIKGKYISELNALESNVLGQKITIRGAYQKMSTLIRRFVYEMTGIKVQNYTLEDIRKLNMPMLEQLIGEYLAPEFAKRTESNVMASLAKTKWVVERWN